MPTVRTDSTEAKARRGNKEKIKRNLSCWNRKWQAPLIDSELWINFIVLKEKHKKQPEVNIFPQRHHWRKIDLHPQIEKGQSGTWVKEWQFINIKGETW